MTQDEIKALASEIVGDGQTPNKFFVTTSPFVRVTDDHDTDSELLDGFSTEDFETQVFDTFEEAKRYYDEVELDSYCGIGTVIIEDRKTGTICERYLEKYVTVEYNQNEIDDSKYFGYVK